MIYFDFANGAVGVVGDDRVDADSFAEVVDAFIEAHFDGNSPRRHDELAIGHRRRSGHRHQRQIQQQFRRQLLLHYPYTQSHDISIISHPKNQSTLSQIAT